MPKILIFLCLSYINYRFFLKLQKKYKFNRFSIRILFIVLTMLIPFIPFILIELIFYKNDFLDFKVSSFDAIFLIICIVSFLYMIFDKNSSLFCNSCGRYISHEKNHKCNKS